VKSEMKLYNKKRISNNSNKNEFISRRKFAWKIFLFCLIASAIDFALTINYIVLPENPQYYEANPILNKSRDIWSFITFFIIINIISLLFLVYPDKLFSPIIAIIIQTVFFIVLPLTKVYIILYWFYLLLR